MTFYKGGNFISFNRKPKESKRQLSSPKWDQLLLIDKEIEQVNISIKNNLSLLDDIKHLKKQFLKESKNLFKKGLIDKAAYLKEKDLINQRAENSTNEVLEELTYNTSFIVKKYDDLASLQGEEQIVDINKKHKKELHKLAKESKQQRKDINKKIRNLIIIEKHNNASKEQIKELKILKKDQKEFEKDIRIKKRKAKANFVKSSKSLKYRTLMLCLLIGVPALMLIGLLVNYLVYFPNPKGRGESFAFNGSTAFPFAISMVMIVLIISVTCFMVFKNTKRIVVDRQQNTTKLLSIGFIASFFDVLGVGCFATSLGMLKATRTFKDDKQTPGTLNMSFCVPILMEGSFLVSATKVDILTLVILVLCAVAGSYFGAMLVGIFNGKAVKLVIAVALFIAAIIMILTTHQVNIFASGLATGLGGWKLAIGIIGFLLIGVLMSFGVGSYAPAMVILTLLGMSPIAIAPIMMCSSAFLMPVTSYKYYKDNNYLPKSALVMMLGGVFGSAISFIFFYIGVQIGMGITADSVAYQSLMKWLTVAVMFYSSITMFFEFFTTGKEKETQTDSHETSHDDLTSIKELNFAINKELEALMNKYNSNIDTKKRVINKDIPINAWVSTSSDVKDKIEKETN